MAIKGVILDFGDTLVAYPLHTVGGQLGFIERFSEGFLTRYPEVPRLKGGVRKFAEELNFERADGGTVPLVERVKEDRLFGAELTDEYAALFEREILAELFEEARLLPDAHPFIEEVKKRGYLVGIMANLPWGSSSTVWEGEFERHGFGAERIDAIVCCVDVGFRKPRPEGILALLQIWELTPRDVVYIGDNRKSDMGAAINAGCYGIFLDRLLEGAEPGAEYHSANDLNEALQNISILGSPALLGADSPITKDTFL